MAVSTRLPSDRKRRCNLTSRKQQQWRSFFWCDPAECTGIDPARHSAALRWLLLSLHTSTIDLEVELIGFQLTAACLCRSQASLVLLPTEVWSSISVQGVLTLDDKRAVRSASAILRRIENAATTKVGPGLSLAAFLCTEYPRNTGCLACGFWACHPQSLISLQVKLDLADERQSAFPLALRPYVQRVNVRAASHAQLLSLSVKLTGVPAAAALELELSFDKTVLDLGSVAATSAEQASWAACAS